MYSVCKQTALVDVHVSTYTCIYMYMYMNNLRRSMFLLVVALLDTCLVTSRLGIVINNTIIS